MDRTLTLIVTSIVLSFPMWANAEIRKVTIKKVEQDLYQTSDGALIQTNYCFAEASGNDAVLKFTKYACHNTLRFDAQTLCEVIDVVE